MDVKESTRKYLFDNGEEIIFLNVTSVDITDNSHKLMCDDGYVIVTRNRVLAVVVPQESRVF